MITIDELKVQLADYGKAVKDLEEALAIDILILHEILFQRACWNGGHRIVRGVRVAMRSMLRRIRTVNSTSGALSRIYSCGFV